MNIEKFKSKYKYLLNDNMIKLDVIEADHLTGEYYLHLITIDKYMNEDIFINNDIFVEPKEDVREMGYKLSIYGTTTFIKKIPRKEFDEKKYLE